MKMFRAWTAVSICLLMVFVGCSRSPTLSSTGYQQALALLNTCLRKDETALQRLQDSVKKAVDSSELSSEEAGALLAVIEKAKTGDWDTAAARTRKLLEKQASSTPPPASANASGEARQRHSH